MDQPVLTISLMHLSLALIPVLVTLVILHKWSLSTGNAVYALGRMLAQLLLIGYVLAWIFNADDWILIVLILLMMVLASSWIALRTTAAHRWRLLGGAVLAIAVGGGFNLALVTQAVLQLDPWYLPRYTIPLAGMVFANAMTAVSLAAERLFAELDHGDSWQQARTVAFQAALIPVVNSLFAVGLVSLPGMMTGQILSGVSPLVAARYQIMIMCIIFSSAGMATAIFLSIAGRSSAVLVAHSKKSV
jgi:putative ABC transport system permease protein